MADDARPAVVLAIVGSRHYSNGPAFSAIMEAWIVQHGRPDAVVSGGAGGVDTLAAGWARAAGVPLKVFPANWAAYGRAAGPRRNAQIVAAATHVLALPSRAGRGTQNTIRQAEAAGLPVTVVYVD